MMLRRQPPALGHIDRHALGDAQQHVMRLVEIALGEEHVVGRDQRDVLGIGQIDQRALDAVLLGHAMAHQLDIEPVREDPRQPLQGLLGGNGIAFQQPPADGAAGTAGQAQQIAAQAGQIVHRDLRRLGAVGLHEGFRDQLDQIAVAGLVLAQQHDRLRIGRPLVLPAGFLGRRADAQLAADDRLDTLTRERDREFQCAK